MFEKIKKYLRTPTGKRKLNNFLKNRRATWSLKIFLLIFSICLCAEFVANNQPLILYLNGKIYFPIFQSISETDIGGDYVTAPDFNDPYVIELVEANGWMIMPPIKFNYYIENSQIPSPAPSPPTRVNLLGTDDQGRDILSRLIYGFRISVIFGFLLTISSVAIGIVMGAIQGYFGGKLDLFLQRFIEIWSGLPTLYILIILSSLIIPNFFWLLLILLLFSWTSLVQVVRAEFLKARNYEFVRAAKALGVSELRIVFRHILPNAFTASLTFIPFILNASITTLTTLDFLGIGLPPSSASLGEMLFQGWSNLNSPWILASVFITISSLLMLLIFIGEGVRDALRN
jgi:microcin C transport system permease protein